MRTLLTLGHTRYKQSTPTWLTASLFAMGVALSSGALFSNTAQADSSVATYQGGKDIENVSLDYYLPQDVHYNPDIPKPADILGYEVGQWHARHDQIVDYFKTLSHLSDRFTFEHLGYTHERRPLFIVKISAAKNKNRLEEMRQAHLAVSDPNQKIDAKNAPLVVFAGFSVHGDESSGANASLLTAYYLAAAEGPEIDAWLDNTVIILEPSFNPDGLGRFGQWANQYRSQVQSADPNHVEYNQAWLRGRQNHYWFDLNRDWLLLQHPESRSRIRVYQDWMPNVLTDHHEMGSNSTYFFQPGIPSRKNPDTPDENVELTATLATFHAKALDNIHSLYYTEESFDDFYYGKGSSYPDAQGTIGILFEQASSRGHAQETINGVLSFPYTVKNQFTTSLSTIRGAYETREHLLDYQQRFFRDNLALANKEKFTGYMLQEDGDPARMHELLSLLAQHRIDAYPVTKNFTYKGTQYETGKAYYVPLAQRNYRLLKGAFSTRQDFPDNTFYDVSAWTLPYAFNVPFDEVKQSRAFQLSKTPWQEPEAFVPSILEPTQIGYAFSWESYFAPRVLAQLQAAGIHTRLASRAMTISTPQGEIHYPHGAVLIPQAYQNKPWQTIQQTLSQLAQDNRIEVSTLTSGLTSTTGMDIGSISIDPTPTTKVMIVIGHGVNVQEAGEAWYYLDRHVNLPVSLVEIERLASVPLHEYSHIILVNGHYRTLTKKHLASLKAWTQAGGTLIAQKGGARWLADNGLLAAKVVAQASYQEQFPSENLTYGDRSDYYAQQRVAGAIFNIKLDLSHPLAVGFSRSDLPIFKDSTFAFEANPAPFVDLASYSKDPVLAGFVSSGNRTVIKDKAAIVSHQLGRGRVVGFADNVNFRAYFWGTSKLLSNAIFWSQYATASPDQALLQSTREED